MYLSRVSGCRLLTILRFRTLKFLHAKELGRRFSLPSISIPVISRTSSPGQLSAMFIIRLNDKFRNVSWSSTRLEYFWMNHKAWSPINNKNYTVSSGYVCKCHWTKYLIEFKSVRDQTCLIKSRNPVSRISSDSKWSRLMFGIWLRCLQPSSEV